jgi:GTP cyclohydrolase II
VQKHLPMKNGHGSGGPCLFGDAYSVGVQRGLAEFRAGRPVIIRAADEAIVALPVDGADADRIAAFKGLFHPRLPQLVITARRARALGLDAKPVLLELDPVDDAMSIFALAADADVDRRIVASPAGLAEIAAIELAKLVQRLPALLVADAAAMSAIAIDPPLVSVAAKAVASFRSEIIGSLTIAGDARVPLQNGTTTRVVVFRDAIGGSPVAIIVGEPDFARPMPVRLHSACLTGDVFGSRRCDCGDQLRLALTRLEEAGGGVILYLEQEGRGLGLANKMRAYDLQDDGLDTVDANTTLGFDDDERDYGVAARMLEMLGCSRVIMLTNNPGKLDGLADAGIEISGRMPLNTPINAHNRRYLSAMARRAGHLLDGILADGEVAEAAPARLRPERPVT